MSRLHRLGLVFAAALAVAACSPEAPSANTAATPAASTPSQSTTPANAATPADNTPVASRPAPVARTPGPIVPPTGPAPVAGTDYVEIPGGTPFKPGEGRIEVVEVFGYVCPACAAFQPLVNDWKRRLPADVDFVYVPAPFGPDWIPYAKGFYVAEAEGLAEPSHDALIHAIHVTQAMPGEGDSPEASDIAAFYAGYGADPKAFLDKMGSFATNAKVNRGKQFMMRSGVQSTPTLVVNGKYRVQGKSFADMLRIADHLVARERATMAASPTPSAAVDDAPASDAGND